MEFYKLFHNIGLEHHNEDIPFMYFPRIVRVSDDYFQCEVFFVDCCQFGGVCQGLEFRVPKPSFFVANLRRIKDAYLFLYALF